MTRLKWAEFYMSAMGVEDADEAKGWRATRFERRMPS